VDHHDAKSAAPDVQSYTLATAGTSNPARRRVVCWGENDNAQRGAAPSPSAGFTTVAITAPGF
jgi:hypothetical protein